MKSKLIIIGDQVYCDDAQLLSQYIEKAAQQQNFTKKDLMDFVDTYDVYGYHASQSAYDRCHEHIGAISRVYSTSFRLTDISIAPSGEYAIMTYHDLTTSTVIRPISEMPS